ncbi:MAG: alanine--tRNA ligase [Azospirillaceae bacterium]|nr:alanine--tRNA ligase [Azospirillaceae bacterium]
MKHLEIRQQFSGYFVEHGHTLVKPSNVIPAGDPTLLFTNAGMNQFKDALLGREKRSYRRCSSIQPCMRVGGKHNDLDAVGKDGRHLTWFEMLGNWSFGDYYKEDAIAFAWELSTRRLGLDPQRIYASVYKDDDESYEIWRKVAGLPDSQIVRLGDIDKGDEENFWSMGPTGPCGPCTELYFDQGESFGQDVVGGATDRYLEFWNLVFMQYDRQEDGSFKPLPMRSVDTGMGLERVASLLQGKSNVFHTDLFMPIIEAVAARSGRDFAGADATAMCVVADHIRALTFVLFDGGEFGRVGRGYVLRRILRRAVMHASDLGLKEPWLYSLVPTVVSTIGVYDVPEDRQQSIAAAIRDEEERFLRTLDRGLVYFRKAADETRQAGGITIAGPAAFQLYDTYGFPVDLTRILAEEEGLAVDLNGFESELEQQRARSKDAQDFYDAGGWVVLEEGTDGGFAGYDLSSLEVQVLRYRDHGDGQIDLILSRTPLYVEGGGELADQGTLSNDAIEIAVSDVKRIDVGVVHTGTIRRGLSAGLERDPVLLAVVDRERRQRKAAHHTATHLAHAALRSILGPATRQMGSLVTEDRLRFDFATDRALTPAELVTIEDMVNGWVLEDHVVNKHLNVPLQQALDMGALAFFADNYGERVRVLEIPSVSIELCGGNHINRTSEIGSFQILSEQSVGAGVRRLEAVTHRASVLRTRDTRELLHQAAAALNVTVEQVPTRILKLTEDLKKLEKERQALARQAFSGKGSDALLAEAEQKDGVLTLVKALGTADPASIKNLLDDLKAKHPAGLFILIGESDGKGSIVVGVGAEAIKTRKLNAGALAKAIGQKLGAGGGGRPDFAQTGFKDVAQDQVEVIARAAVAEAVGD